ncbi:AI-2E family transporter [candidate division WWE3 bacterium]|jgi:predicted PurR-regulated permease PerM|nr:AI-2E family transporter [candidate division WWE3 bacterium]
MGGLLFWILGINTALTWGFIMIILSIIPVVGAGIVWIPAGLILLASGAIWQGITMLLAGFLLIGTIDNLLRPYLIGKSTKLPESIILLSMLGGIATFGLVGFVIGPIIAGILYTLLEASHDQIGHLKNAGQLSNH